MAARDEDAGRPGQDQVYGKRIEEVLDLLIPAFEFVNLVEEQHHTLARSALELLGVLPDEGQESSLAQGLKIESNEEKRVRADSGGDEVLDDLVEGCGLSDLPWTAEDVDERLGAAKCRDDRRDSATSELRRSGPDAMRGVPPGIQVAEDLLDFWADLRHDQVINGTNSLCKAVGGQALSGEAVGLARISAGIGGAVPEDRVVPDQPRRIAC